MATSSQDDDIGRNLLAPEDAAEIARLETEIVEFTAQLASARAEAIRLQREEDPMNGVFHAKGIFDHKQDAMRLEVEIQLRRVKINRIRIGPEGPGLFQ